MPNKRSDTTNKATTENPLESQIGELITLVKSQNNLITDQGEQLSTLKTEVNALKQKPSLFSVKSDKERLAMAKNLRKGDPMLDIREGLIGKADRKFKAGNVVITKPNSPKHTTYKETLAVIKNFIYTDKHGRNKYKVHYEGIGEDSMLEEELELVLD